MKRAEESGRCRFERELGRLLNARFTAFLPIVTDSPRLLELRAKEELSEEEMEELVALSSAGTILSLPDLDRAGLHEVQVAIANLIAVGDRIARARSAGFLVEALSLRSQLLELFLRLYLGAKRANAISTDDRRPLGALIDAASEAGLDSDLTQRLQRFNTARITGLHRLLLGAVPYEALSPLLLASDGVVPLLVSAVATECGVPLPALPAV